MRGEILCDDAAAALHRKLFPAELRVLFQSLTSHTRPTISSALPGSRCCARVESSAVCGCGVCFCFVQSGGRTIPSLLITPTPPPLGDLARLLTEKKNIFRSVRCDPELRCWSSTVFVRYLIISHSNNTSVRARTQAVTLSRSKLKEQISCVFLSAYVRRCTTS